MKLMQLCVGMVRTNCYIVYDEATREAAVIDPGDNAKSILHAVNDILANEGTKVTFGGMTATYMATPGHTPGSSVIRIGDCLFTGDTLFRHECGRCDLEGGDFSAMLRSLKRLHDLDGDYKVFPGHEGISTLNEERAYNPYMLQAMGK